VTRHFALRSLMPASLAALMVLAGFAPGHADLALAEGANERDTYILFTEGSRSIDVSGSTAELTTARAQRIGLEAMLYVRQGQAAYVIRDVETLRQAQGILTAEEDLSARQTVLSSQQSALSRLQAQLAREQAKLAALQSRAARPEADDLIREQEVLGREIRALGKIQDSLSRGVSVVGRGQTEMAQEARANFLRLFTNARSRGLAQRIE
jgi:bla regulator protein blaR1